MARQNRADIFDPREVTVLHCIQRAVRRAMLCGVDPISGKSFEHRRQWIRDRLEELAGIFGIDVLGFAIMGNHLHVILRNRPDVVKPWSDEQVARVINNYRTWKKRLLQGPKDETSDEAPRSHQLAPRLFVVVRDVRVGDRSDPRDVPTVEFREVRNIVIERHRQT